MSSNDPFRVSSTASPSPPLWTQVPGSTIPSPTFASPTGGHTTTILPNTQPWAAEREILRRVPPRDTLTIDDEVDRMRMIAFRLRLGYRDQPPFDYVATHKGDEKVFVFVVSGNTPVILEDDLAMFPSDTLVTQLRLMMK